MSITNNQIEITKKRNEETMNVLSDAEKISKKEESRSNNIAFEAPKELEDDDLSKIAGGTPGWYSPAP